MIDLPVLDGDTVREDQSGERYWRSLGQLQGDAEIQEYTNEEFLPGASEGPGKASRRQFMQLMGASMALAGLTACRRPVEKIMPYTRQPEEIVAGLPLFYATAMPLKGVLKPLLVESHEGRPTKIEGNPEHPMSQGSAGVFEQASILNLYDPDRSKLVRRDGEEANWADLVTELRRVQGTAGRIAVLAEPSSSPTVARLREDLESAYGDLRWITYREEGDDPVLFGLQEAYGQPVRPLYRFSEADVIVSLDADFLGPTDPNYIFNTREFAESRRLDDETSEMSRLYVVESAFSVTGGMADNRLRLKATEVTLFASALAAELGVGNGRAQDLSPRAREYVRAIAQDLQGAGQAVVLAGESQPASVHALCAAINQSLGSIGQTVEMLSTGEPSQRAQAIEIEELIADMRGGQVDALIMIGVNPVYSASPDLGFVDALQAVPFSLHLGMHLDETARASMWHVPRSYYLEAWGDGRAYDGSLSIIQPLIAPLYEETRSEVELLNLLASGEERSGYDIVRLAWQNQIPGSFEEGWRRAVHDGFLPDTTFATTGGAPGSVDEAPPVATGRDDIELVFRLDPTVLDGSFANNAWLQEIPDPATKLVWDNVAIMSPATAERLGLRSRYSKGRYRVDLVRIAASGRDLELPIWIMPGHADDTITVNLGYGREIGSERELRSWHIFDLDHKIDVYNNGPIANGIGQNVSVLRSAAMERVIPSVQVEKAAGTYTIVTTQEHGSMEGRPLMRRASMDEYRQNPTFAPDAEPLVTDEPYSEYPELWSERHPSTQPAYRDNLYFPNQWGMSIDLNACTGCNACVVACVSENNIPVVGKHEVGVGRQMHWIRLDRYFVSRDGQEDDPEMLVQPMLCQHCENAPCESVCPVAATIHSPDGLNSMIYNRCIGTRYCANNCPYKVRKFNFYAWTNVTPDSAQMAYNPNVTVRSRGVMEKCTWCMQRIRRGQQRARLEDRRLQDGEIQTACQQACPARAITFGDLNDPNSRVVAEKRMNRRYEMLAYLNVKPRLSYLARITNPNPNLSRTEA